MTSSYPKIGAAGKDPRSGGERAVFPNREGPGLPEPNVFDMRESREASEDSLTGRCKARILTPGP